MHYIAASMCSYYIHDIWHKQIINLIVQSCYKSVWEKKLATEGGAGERRHHNTIILSF